MNVQQSPFYGVKLNGPSGNFEFSTVSRLSRFIRKRDKYGEARYGFKLLLRFVSFVRVTKKVRCVGFARNTVSRLSRYFFFSNKEQVERRATEIEGTVGTYREIVHDPYEIFPFR